MDQKYYNIPLRFEDVLARKNRTQYCSRLEESINSNISLIIGTKLQEFRADLNYGCAVWDMDFVVPKNLIAWKDDIKNSLELAIMAHETRIAEIERFAITVVEEKNRKNHQILHFEIQGSIKGTSAILMFSDTLFFSPYTR